MSPEDLVQVLRRIPVPRDERVVVGLDAPDDAAVFLVNPDLAVVQTVDFFPPVVDDPYVFGQIAAANAMSDCWAMGVDPLFALNLVAFPVRRLGGDALVRVLAGGADKCAEAGAVIVGGHSIEDAEPKYGLAVTALGHPARLWRRGGGRPGDVLVLTKPLGVGVITTALKQGKAPREVVEAAVRCMLELNKAAAAAARAAGGVRACTDVSGFGLLGHLHEMAAQSGVAARLAPARVPVLEGARELAAAGAIAGGTRRNLAYVSPYVAWGRVDEVDRLVLADATTSGGLLLAVAPERALALTAALGERGCGASVIGRLVEGEPGHISLVEADSGD